MAVLKTLISGIVKKDEYPATVIDSITITKNRRGLTLHFAAEGESRVNPLNQTFIADKPNMEALTDAIKKAATPKERTAIKLVKLPSVGKSK